MQAITLVLAQLAKTRDRVNIAHWKIISNTSWLFFGRFFRIAVSLFTATWVARYLGPDQFGLLQYALAFTTLFLPLSTAQMDTVVSRDLVRQPEQRFAILSNAVALQLAGGTLAASLAIATIMLVAPANRPLQLLVAIIALKYVLNSSQPIESWFEAQITSKYSVLSDNLAFVIITLLRCLLIVIKAPVYAFAITISLEALIYAIGLVSYYQRFYPPGWRWQLTMSQITYLLRESWPLALSSTAAVIYTNIDRVMLGQMLGDEAVGLYSSAANLSDAWWFLPTIVASSLYPTIIQAKNCDRQVYRQQMQWFYDLNSALAYGLIALVMPLSGLIITLLYTETYRSAAPVLAVYIWSTLFVF